MDWLIVIIIHYVERDVDLCVTMMYSAQCVSAIRDQRLHNMEVEFAVINEIVDELPPLKEWWTCQSLNKILAGKKFEDHLQEVTVDNIIGYLWKYGRFCVNPDLSMNATLSNNCSNHTSAWISKSLSSENIHGSVIINCCILSCKTSLHPLSNTTVC